MKKCRNCKAEFIPFVNSLQSVCGPKCAIEYNKKKEEEKRKKEVNGWKKDLRTKSWYEDKLQQDINKLVRMIDNGLDCISCKGTKKDQAGHYHSTGAHPALRFNLHNIHKQDYYCNVEKSANIPGYNKGLIERYGKEYQQYVEFELPKEYPLLKLTIPELEEARKKVKEIIKTHRSTEYYDPESRKNLRSIYNIIIGIY